MRLWPSLLLAAGALAEELPMDAASHPLAILITIRPLWWFAAGIILIIAETVVIFWLYREKKNLELQIAGKAGAPPTIIVHGRESKAPPEGASAMDTLVKTLSEREKAILDIIVQQGGETTQARVYAMTRIPKTSLSRAVQALSKKRIIETEPFGKVVKLRLQPWVREQAVKSPVSEKEPSETSS
jgi:uncharacterized membrane protein